MNPNKLQTPIDYLKGVGPLWADLLRKELGIRTYDDLLNFFPFRYIDKTRFYKIRELQQNSSEVQVVGKITLIKMLPQKRGKRLMAVFEDETGQMELTWFRGHKWIRENLKTNASYVIFGKTKWFNGRVSMPHPEMELLSERKKNAHISVQPVYPSTEKLLKGRITNRAITKLVQQIFAECSNAFPESLSEPVLGELKLISKTQALFNIHFPKSQNLLTKAQFRLKFEEFFFMQLQLVQKNLMHKTKIKGYAFEQIGENFNTFFYEHLPFELTGAQKRVLKEIRNDLGSGAHMNRLLQGDVGSGKTIVAFMSMLIALDNGFQACLMTPTEILSVQHYNGFIEIAKNMNTSVLLLTGSTSTSKRKEIHKKLKNGELDILIGTHTLIEEKVEFKNLGLAIIDEQHRFGVAQRSKLWKKNKLPPHVLVMTATPIPRTLAMSMYGDLDISTIDELPPGRKNVKTVHRFDSNRLKVFRFLKDEIKKGRQIYIVYPLIQESEKMDYKDLMDGYESIVREFPPDSRSFGTGPDYQVSIVHGKMKPADKAYEMGRFVKGETNIMVATTVIEVGVDVPNASVMVIESAERFGLSQLHQLRGRVGRGAEQSYCILMTGHKLSDDAKTRMQTMTATNDGFKIAEVDLKLRGPGDMMGTKQSGILDLKIADMVQDQAILKLARNYAFQILKADPNLSRPENASIKRAYTQILRNKTNWERIS